MHFNLSSDRWCIKCHRVKGSLTVRLESLTKRIDVDLMLDSNPAALTSVLNRMQC